MSIDPNRPAYRILSPNGFFADDDTLYIVSPDGVYPEIYWDKEPNEEMEPLNEPARVRMNSYLEMLDKCGREAAAKAGKAFAGRPRDLDGALQVATAIAREEQRIQGVRKDSTVERIEASETPETSISNPKRGRGRPAKNSLLIRDQVA